MKLTVLEARVLEAHRLITKDGMGARNVEDMLADNFSWTDVGELSEHTGLSVPETKGVVGSLTKKGLVDTEKNDLCLTDEGIKEAWRRANGEGVEDDGGVA